MECESDSAVLWEHRFEDLGQWKATHGDCNVPKAEGKLGRWVVRQRELHKKSKLEPDRRQKLDGLGFVWNTNEAAWEHRYKLLVKYAQVHGHCCVPISDPTLGMWVAKMRANRRRNKLAAHRVEKLDAINFVWNTAETDWMDKYDRLLEFRANHGHSCVPFNEGELGWWVNTQRQNKRKGKLPEHRERLLNEAGFVWSPQEFLAARRRHQAAERANAAQSLASKGDASYRASLPVFGHATSPYSDSACISNPPKRRLTSFPFSEAPVVGGSGTAVPAVLSPTSIKRVKVEPPNPRAAEIHWASNTTSPSSISHGYQGHRPSPQWVGYGAPSGSVSPEKFGRGYDPCRNDTSRHLLESVSRSQPRKDSRSDVQSIASLLSPSPKRTISAPTFVPVATPIDRTMGTSLTDSMPSSSGALSSICGIPRMHGNRAAGMNPTVARSTTFGQTRDFILPPISSLRGFNETKPDMKTAT